jgi:hypothetical protein
VGRPRRTIVARRLFGLPEVVGDRHLINVTVGPDLGPVILSVEQPPDYRIESPGWASFPKCRAARPNRFRIHHQAGGRWRAVDLPETFENFHHLHPLGEDGWLLARIEALEVLKLREPPSDEERRPMASVLRDILDGDPHVDVRRYAAMAAANSMSEGELADAVVARAFDESEDIDLRWNAFGAIKRLGPTPEGIEHRRAASDDT